MPKRPPKRCANIGCNNYATNQGRCDNHQRKAWENPSRNTQALTGAERARFRHRTLQAADHTCAHCGGLATEADHIREIADGGDPHDWQNNGQALCTPCHATKTKQARRTRRQQQPPDRR